MTEKPSVEWQFFGRMTAARFKIKVAEFVHSVMKEKPSGLLPPSLKATMHYETLRHIMATIEPGDWPFREDRKLILCGAEIFQTEQIPTGAMKIELA